MPAAAADSLMDVFAAKVDVNDAVGQWWTSQDDVDTPAELSERMVRREGDREETESGSLGTSSLCRPRGRSNLDRIMPMAVHVWYPNMNEWKINCVGLKEKTKKKKSLASYVSDDFFESMRLDACDIVLVVGHSLFLQAMLRRFASPALSAAAPELVRNLKECKLQNCGCLGLDVAFEGDDGTPAIVDAKLMFRSRCMSK